MRKERGDKETARERGRGRVRKDKQIKFTTRPFGSLPPKAEQ